MDSRMAAFKQGDRVAIKYSGHKATVVAASDITVKVEDKYGRVFFLKPTDVRPADDEG